MNTNDQSVQTLELLEERAEVQKQRIHSQVVLTKQTRTRTIEVPVSLTEEYLVIEYQPAELGESAIDASHIPVIDAPADTHSQIQLNGELITLSQDTPIEILLSRETALIHKTTHAIERIDLQTHTITQAHTLTTELKKEVLDIQEGEDLLVRADQSDLSES